MLRNCVLLRRVGEVQSCKSLFRMLVMALWLSCTFHCELEANSLLTCDGCYSASSIDFASASIIPESKPTPPPNCSDCQICQGVESGGYECSSSNDNIIRCPLVLLFISSSVVGPGIAKDHQPNCLAGLSPPDLTVSWRFFERAVLPARAPSFLS
jgi:hypothetical protein